MLLTEIGKGMHCGCKLLRLVAPASDDTELLFELSLASAHTFPLPVVICQTPTGDRDQPR